MKGGKKKAHAADVPRIADGRAGDFLGAVVPLHARQTPGLSPDADLSNVIPISSRRKTGPDKRAPDVPVSRDDRPAPPTRRLDQRRLLVLLTAASLVVHAGLLAAFNQPPPPAASLGEIVVSAELVIGTDRAAGQNKTPTESEMDSAAAPKKDEPVAEQNEAPQKTEEKIEEKAPEPETATAAPEEPKKAEPEAAQPAVTTAAVAPDPVAELPLPSKEPVETKPSPAVQPAPPKPAELKTEPAPPKKPERKAEPAPRKKPVRESDEGKSNRRRATPASTPSVSSNSVGRGRSDADTNYRGLVAAHLARYKQFPADARARGDQGTAAVTFSLDGGGRVTSARLARGSGVSSIDRETLSMVHRASPFPAPPGGRGMSFTVPVSFYLR